VRPVRDYSYVLELPKQEQAAILSKAEKVRKFRQSARAPPSCPEPKRNKCHWDHLLEEAEWMAKEFQRSGRAATGFLLPPTAVGGRHLSTGCGGRHHLQAFMALPLEGGSECSCCG
jgi:hypothetical protein